MEARRAHNPEVVGSSPASATRKSSEIVMISELLFVFRDKKLGIIFDIIRFDPNLTPIGVLKSWENTEKCR